MTYFDIFLSLVSCSADDPKRASMPPYSSRVPRRSSSLSPRTTRSCRLRSSNDASNADGTRTALSHARTYTRATLPRTRSRARNASSMGIDSNSRATHKPTAVGYGLSCLPVKQAHGSLSPTSVSIRKHPKAGTGDDEHSSEQTRRRRKKKASYSQKSLPMGIILQQAVPKEVRNSKSRVSRTFTNTDLVDTGVRDTSGNIEPRMTPKYSFSERKEREIAAPSPSSPPRSKFSSHRKADRGSAKRRGSIETHEGFDEVAFSEYRQRPPRSRSPRFLSTDQYHFPRFAIAPRAASSGTSADTAERGSLHPSTSQSPQLSQNRLDPSQNRVSRPTISVPEETSQPSCTCASISSPPSTRSLTPTFSHSRRSPHTFSFNFSGADASSSSKEPNSRTPLLSAQRPLTPPASSSSRYYRAFRGSKSVCNACKGVTRTLSNAASTSSAGHLKSMSSSVAPRAHVRESESTPPTPSNANDNLTEGKRSISSSSQYTMSFSLSQNDDEEKQQRVNDSISPSSKESSQSSSRLSPKDAMEKLHALDRLRGEGLLSDEEYNQRKQQLIDILTGIVCTRVYLSMRRSSIFVDFVEHQSRNREGVSRLSRKKN